MSGLAAWLDELEEAHQPTPAYCASETYPRDMCTCGDWFHDECSVRLALRKPIAALRAVLTVAEGLDADGLRWSALDLADAAARIRAAVANATEVSS